MPRLGFYASRVDKGDQEFFQEIAVAPCLLQEEIPKKSELRINLVGDECYAWRIYSQASEASALDCRLDTHVPMERVEIAETTRERLTALVKSWRLTFSAMDMIETPDDELVFLEANVGGNWLWLEPGGDSKVAEALARALIINARPGRKARERGDD